MKNLIVLANIVTDCWIEVLPIALNFVFSACYCFLISRAHFNHLLATSGFFRILAWEEQAGLPRSSFPIEEKIAIVI